ncbi:reverse transcriptase domain-containing protein, partial [Tanacetum coccineum]
DVKGAPEMMRVTTTFLRGEVAASSSERKKLLPSWKQQEAGQKQNFKKGGFRNHLKSTKVRAKAGQERSGKSNKKGETSGKDKPLAILMVQPWQRVAKQRITQTFSPELVISFQPLGEEDGMKDLMIIKVEMGGHFVHRMYVDGGSSLEILYEHCFNRFCPKVRSQMVLATTSLVGFSGEIIWPLGQISLLVKIGDEEHSTSAWMNFMVVRSPSPYNGIIGRPEVRRIQAVLSIAHRMLKFPVTGGTVTLRSSRIIPLECTMVSGPGTQQPGSTLTEEGRTELCGLLRRNLDVFAWKPAVMNGVPRHIVEHMLNILEGCIPVRQKKKGLKNAGATYQRLVDKAFQKQIGWNLEVYVDDLVIKSRTEQEVIRDTEETFKTLREINMKLNLKKYAFRMRECTFLGYKVNADGLRVCPDNVEAVLNLPSPKCL